MNGISPLPASHHQQLLGQVSESQESPSSFEVTEAGEAKNGVKRPSQDEGLEAPEQKKTNIDDDENVPIVGNEHPEVNVGEDTAGDNVGLEENVFMTAPASLLQELPQPYMLPASELPPLSQQLVGSCVATTIEQVFVPDSMVGLIIGRGGEQISRLQAESRCKIQMAPDSQGHSQRLCTISGSAEAILVAKALIEQVITNEQDKAAARGQSGADQGMFEMMIPGNLVARIIGKGGEVIKALQEETGSKIVIIQDSRDYALEKPLRITGGVESVELARARVEAVLAAEQAKINGMKRGWSGSNLLNNNNIHGCYDTTPSFDITEVISIPSTKVGLVMGKGGETIRQICLSSGAHCQVDKNAPDGAREKNIVIKGRPENVIRAKMMVSEKVGDVYDRGYGGGDHSQVSNQIGSELLPGQTDYSKQWAEYYRSLGMLKEAEIIEQQMLVRAAGQLGVTQASQPDYSAQWAEYYRSLGKFREAEAIEAQMKMKGVTNVENGAFIDSVSAQAAIF